MGKPSPSEGLALIAAWSDVFRADPFDLDKFNSAAAAIIACADCWGQDAVVWGLEDVLKYCNDEFGGVKCVPARLVTARFDDRDEEGCRYYDLRSCLRSLTKLRRLFEKEGGVPPPPKAPAAAKGKPGRRGHPQKILDYALSLRDKDRDMKAVTIRNRCLEKFRKDYTPPDRVEDHMPPDGESFRRWLNHHRRANRAD